MGLSDEEREKWEEVKEWLDGHFEDIGFWRKQEQLAHDRGNRIRELEEDLEIAIDERNGLIDSVMKMYSDNTRLREAIEWVSAPVNVFALDPGARDTFIKELRRRAGITTTENNQEGDAGNQKE
jgi:hypothetical protein